MEHVGTRCYNIFFYGALHERNTFSHQHSAVEVRDALSRGAHLGDLASKFNRTQNLLVRQGTSMQEMMFTELSSLRLSLTCLKSGMLSQGLQLESLSVDDNNRIASVDINGWSPNRRRRFEMQCLDIFVSFFDIPDDMRASKLFDDL